MGGALLSIGAATAGGVGIASAATNTDGQNSIVDKLASKFNLNKEEVQKVFDEERANHHAERQAKMTKRIDQAVKDGKLTQDQADKLEAKLKEIQAEREKARENGDKPDPAAMREKMDEFKKWLEDNNIPKEYGMPMGGGKGHHGRMGMHELNQ